jgi:hypothetical protein
LELCNGTLQEEQFFVKPNPVIFHFEKQPVNVSSACGCSAHPEADQADDGEEGEGDDGDDHFVHEAETGLFGTVARNELVNHPVLLSQVAMDFNHAGL